jgi:hypothetical protein
VVIQLKHPGIAMEAVSLHSIAGGGALKAGEDLNCKHQSITAEWDPEKCTKKAKKLCSLTSNGYQEVQWRFSIAIGVPVPWQGRISVGLGTRQFAQPPVWLCHSTTNAIIKSSWVSLGKCLPGGCHVRSDERTWRLYRHLNAQEVCTPYSFISFPASFLCMWIRCFYWGHLWVLQFLVRRRYLINICSRKEKIINTYCFLLKQETQAQRQSILAKAHSK